MKFEMIRQNAESMIQLSYAYNDLLVKKRDLENSLKNLKKRKEIKMAKQNLEQINYKISNIKNYILGIIVSIQKIAREEKLKHNV